MEEFRGLHVEPKEQKEDGSFRGQELMGTATE